LTFTVPAPGGDDDATLPDDDSTGSDDDTAPPDDDTTPSPTDADGDGSPAELDCDDGDPEVHPGAEEDCDGIDDNCDGVRDDGLNVLDFYLDWDGDGYGNGSTSVPACARPEGYVGNGDDCADSVAAIHPGAGETCDGLDNDCDGQNDEGVQVQLYQDWDADGYGSLFPLTVGCPGQGAADNNRDCDDYNAAATPADDDADGFSGCDGDCDDGDPAMNPTVDADGDGWTPCATNGIVDCDDGDPSAFPGVDLDGDGASPCWDGFSAWDCDDGDPASHANAWDACDGVDQDCDGWVDDDSVPVAVIHGGDGQVGVAWLSALAGANYCTTYIDVADVATTTLSPFRLLVLTSDTGSVNGWYGDAEAIRVPVNSCWTHVMALGAGGAGFLLDWGLPGFGPGEISGGAGSYVYPADPWGGEWSYPEEVLPPGSPGPALVYGAENDRWTANPALLSGQVVGWADAAGNQAMITRDWPCPSLTWWGWDPPHSVATADGQHLWMNLVQWVIGAPPASL
jgi:hypothetical protein